MLRKHSLAGRARLSLEPLENRALPTTFAVAATLDVVNPTDGKLSLREAVSRANAHAGADTIVLPAGVFKIALDGANDDANATGDFDITDSLTIQGSGAGYTTIDGQQKDRLFDVIGQFGVQFVGVTLRHGGGEVDGGAIHVAGANVGLVNCVVSDNRGKLGGGIGVESGNVTLTASTVCRNIAATNGGGISAGTGTITLRGSVVRRNLAINGGGLSGFTVTLIGSTVTGNSASSIGGGLDGVTATLTDSTVSGNHASLDAGGMNVANAKLTHCTVSGNSAGAGGGGGLACFAATLTNCVVSGNSAGVNGGGIQASSEVTLINTKLSGNAAGGNGGGLFELGAATLTNSIVTGNSARNGGGVHADSLTATGSRVTGNFAFDNGGGLFGNQIATFNCTISGNSASTSGGGIHADSATVTNSTLSGNSADAGNGGGILADRAAVTNSTVSGNSAGDSGGGICAFVGASIVNATIVENSAFFLGGGVFRPTSATSPVFVQNTIIARNLIGFAGAGADASGAFTTGGHNLIGVVDGGTGFGDHGTDLFGSAALPLDPKLGPLTNNGGTTQTHALLSGSPAIDHGDNTNAPAFDQRGLPRRKDGNGDGIAVVDIGAFER